MVIFPAIDIKDGQCVRLRRGDYATVYKVAEDPFAAVDAFRAAGARHLHLVDLDGARDGVRKNRALLIALARAFGGFCEIGGGIRDRAAAEDYLDNGFSRVVLGSTAVTDPAFLAEMLARHGERTAVGVDALAGEVRVSGWEKGGGVGYLSFIRDCMARGARHFIFTDIARDGMETGPNLAALAEIKALGCGLTASGGIRDGADLRALRALGVEAAICGKSLYAGTLDLGEALRLCEEGPHAC